MITLTVVKVESYCQEYGILVVATTERKVISPTKHSFSSILYSSEQDAYFSKAAYDAIEVVDRIGSGDAYVAGVLTGLLKFKNYQKAVEIGDGMSALKNTIPVDLLAADYDEILRLVESHKNNGIQDEMNR